MTLSDIRYFYGVLSLISLKCGFLRYHLLWLQLVIMHISRIVLIWCHSWAFVESLQGEYSVILHQMLLIIIIIFNLFLFLYLGRLDTIKIIKRNIISFKNIRLIVFAFVIINALKYAFHMLKYLLILNTDVPAYLLALIVLSFFHELKHFALLYC